MILLLHGDPVMIQRIPRESGDDPALEVTPPDATEYSPRERG